MAEAFLRRLAGDRVHVASAGTEATRVHPLAIRAMDEVGIDLRAHTSKRPGKRGRAAGYLPPRAGRGRAAHPAGVAGAGRPVSGETTIVGAGAIGGILGAHLARAGEAVVLVDQDAEHVEAIRRHGLEVTGPGGGFRVTLPACRPEEVRGPLGRVVLAVKALHTRDALVPIVPLLTPESYVVSMQNGLEEETIAALVGAERTVGACLTFGGHYQEPGRVVYSGPGTLRVGELDGRLTARVHALARLLAAFHPTEATDNIHGWLWAKLVLGAVYFATATVDADVLDILADDARRRILGALAAEAYAVAEALGVRVETLDGFDPCAFRGGPGRAPAAVDAAWEAQRAYWRRGVARRTGVWRDLAVRRRRTEAAPILGALLAAADRAGVAAPRARALARVIEAIEAGQRGLAWANLDALGPG
jgi:2-dehydropantoate 2-reductase